MGCLWGYNGLRGFFNSLKGKGRSFGFICLLGDFVPCKSMFKMVMDEIRELCAGSGFIPRPKAKHRVNDSPLHRSSPTAVENMPLYFACRRLLCSASRTSRDTPQSSIAWTLHASLFISRGLKCSNLGWLRFQSQGSSCLTGGPKNRKNPCIPLKLPR
jgi:hypothetical protein